MTEANELKNAIKSRDYLPTEYYEFGRVGNSELGQGFKRTLGADQTVRVDEGATYTYIGYAVPGTATSSATWKVKRVTIADNTILYADGDPFYDNIYDNRASLSYS